MPITSDEYWGEIEYFAREATKEAREYDRDVYDVLHEMIDRHQWIIYFRYNAAVLSHSENAGHGLNEGLISTVKDHDEYMMQAAYWAMVADVQAYEDYDADPEDHDAL